MELKLIKDAIIAINGKDIVISEHPELWTYFYIGKNMTEYFEEIKPFNADEYAIARGKEIIKKVNKKTNDSIK